MPFHLIVPELGTTSSAATIMAFMKNILSFSLNCTTLSNHYSKFIFGRAFGKVFFRQMFTARNSRIPDVKENLLI